MNGFGQDPFDDEFEPSSTATNAFRNVKTAGDFGGEMVGPVLSGYGAYRAAKERADEYKRQQKKAQGGGIFRGVGNLLAGAASFIPGAGPAISLGIRGATSLFG
jgi:hypothetical protein